MITDLDVEEDKIEQKSVGVAGLAAAGKGLESAKVYLDETDSEVAVMGFMNFDITNSPIKEANGWVNAPEDAKEFTMLTSNGYVRRPCLILKNEDGIYDRVAIYKSKKETEPMLVMGKDIYVPEFVDDVLAKEEVKPANRALRILELAEDGSKVRLWLSSAYDAVSYTHLTLPTK